MSNNFKKLGLNLLILVIQGFSFIGKLLTAALGNTVNIVYKISKKIFGKSIIKSYGYCLIIKNKLNLGGGKKRFNSILTSSYTIHATIIIVTLIILIINLTVSNRQTLAANDTAPKPALFYLIKSEFAEDQELIVETFSESAVITEAEENYLKNLASVRVQPHAEMKAIGEVEERSPESIVQGGSAIVKPNIAKTNKIKRPRAGIVYHIVKPNETVSTIASDYDITVSTILWENDLNAYSVIRPGQSLAILPVSGISYKIAKGDNLGSIAKKYDIEESEIAEYNKLADNSYLKIGQKLIIPGGQKKYTAPAAASYSGLAALKNLVAPPSARAVAGNKMNWPTVGHRITQYYTWRHHAVDIANKTGTAIYAADSGVVESAGWGTGYGNQIVIDHGGGKKTRYAHNSQHYVSKGDKVAKGQTIAAMGSTGWSTGPHVHFEVIINGYKVNPLDYIK